MIFEAESLDNLIQGGIKLGQQKPVSANLKILRRKSYENDEESAGPRFGRCNGSVCPDWLRRQKQRCQHG